MATRPDFENIDYRSANEAQKAMRDEYIWHLRVRGYTLREIQADTGIDICTVSNLIKATSKANVRAEIDTYIDMQLARLDMLKKKYLEIAEKHKVSFSQSGRVLSLNDEPVDDDSPALAAYSKYLDVLKEESKLLGLYAPEKQEVETKVTINPKVTELIGLMNDESA